mgnify:FL=1|tara:strand:- start:91 stop:450 length:360 start_codon:yes stop_codon:yes gene_type:complete
MATIESSLQQSIWEEDNRLLTYDGLTDLIQQSLTREYPDDDDYDGVLYISQMAAGILSPPPHPNPWNQQVYSRADLKKAVEEAHRLADGAPFYDGDCRKCGRGLEMESPDDNPICGDCA